MTFPDYLLLAVVLLVGVPAAVRFVRGSVVPRLRNATAAALVGSYLVSEAIYFFTGESFNLRFYMLVDLTVIAVTACKAPVRPVRQPAAFLDIFWRERSLWDRIVIALFAPVWMSYFLLNGDVRWFSLYWLALAQFIAAGGEAVQYYFSARPAKAGADPDSSPGSMYTASWREWGFG